AAGSGYAENSCAKTTAKNEFSFRQSAAVSKFSTVRQLQLDSSRDSSVAKTWNFSPPPIRRMSFCAVGCPVGSMTEFSCLWKKRVARSLKLASRESRVPIGVDLQEALFGREETAGRLGDLVAARLMVSNRPIFSNSVSLNAVQRDLRCFRQNPFCLRLSYRRNFAVLK